MKGILKEADIKMPQSESAWQQKIYEYLSKRYPYIVNLLPPEIDWSAGPVDIEEGSGDGEISIYSNGKKVSIPVIIRNWSLKPIDVIKMPEGGYTSISEKRIIELSTDDRSYELGNKVIPYTYTGGLTGPSTPYGVNTSMSMFYKSGSYIDGLKVSLNSLKSFQRMISEGEVLYKHGMAIMEKVSILEDPAAICITLEKEGELKAYVFKDGKREDSKIELSDLEKLNKDQLNKLSSEGSVVIPNKFKRKYHFNDLYKEAFSVMDNGKSYAVLCKNGVIKEGTFLKSDTPFVLATDGDIVIGDRGWVRSIDNIKKGSINTVKASEIATGDTVIIIEKNKISGPFTIKQASMTTSRGRAHHAQLNNGSDVMIYLSDKVMGIQKTAADQNYITNSGASFIKVNNKLSILDIDPLSLQKEGIDIRSESIGNDKYKLFIGNDSAIEDRTFAIAKIASMGVSIPDAISVLDKSKVITVVYDDSSSEKISNEVYQSIVKGLPHINKLIKIASENEVEQFDDPNLSALNLMSPDQVIRYDRLLDILEPAESGVASLLLDSRRGKSDVDEDTAREALISIRAIIDSVKGSSGSTQ